MEAPYCLALCTNNTGTSSWLLAVTLLYCYGWWQPRGMRFLFPSNFLESRNLKLPSFHSMCRITFMMFMSITLCASRNAYVFLKMLKYVSTISRIKLLLGQTFTICWMCLYLQLDLCIPHTSWTNISSKEMHRFVKGHWEILKMVQVCHQFRILWEQKCCLVDTWFGLVRVAALLSIL